MGEGDDFTRPDPLIPGTTLPFRALLKAAKPRGSMRALKSSSLHLPAVAIALAGLSVMPWASLAHDMLAAHMAQHILAMNGAALLAALVIDWRPAGSAALAGATLAQISALVIWHLPGVFAAAHHSVLMTAFMNLSLLAVALLFWRAVLADRRAMPWARILALLVTAKVFCLLGAGLVFSRRPLYPALGNPEAWGLSPLEDQQLAGLLMLGSCAGIYIAAAVTLFVRWLYRAGAPRRDAVVQL
jgi:putative membrane protein